MKIVAVHMETTGVVPGLHSILELSAVAIDLSLPEERNISTLGEAYSLPCYSKLIAPTSGVKWNKVALEMHEESGLLKESTEQGEDFHEASLSFRAFLLENRTYSYRKKWRSEEVEPYETTIFAGKNFGSFGFQFLLKENYLGKMSCSHSFIDPANYYMDLLADNAPPDLDSCLRRAGVEADIGGRSLPKAASIALLIAMYANSSTHRIEEQ